MLLVDGKCRINRTYDDYTRFLEENDNPSAVIIKENLNTPLGWQLDMLLPLPVFNHDPGGYNPDRRDPDWRFNRILYRFIDKSVPLYIAI